MDNLKTVQYRTKAKLKRRKIHSLFRYPAKLIPNIPKYFLKPEFIPDDGIVLDPFCGSGTVMIEAQLAGYNSKGIDINPLSILISKVKTTPLNWDEINNELSNFKNQVNSVKYILPSFKNKDYWFTENISIGLSKTISWINTIENSTIKDFFKFTFTNLIRKLSNADQKIFPPVYSDKVFSSLQNMKEKEVYVQFIDRIIYNKKILIDYFNQVYNNNEEVPNVEYIEGSAKNEHLPKMSIDLIITSPPYINAQKYLRTTKFELFWLNILSDKDKLELDRKFIGTEKFTKKDYHLLDDIDRYPWNKIIYKILKDDKYRALIAHKYFLDMKETIQQCYNYLKFDGYFILIIGNNTIRGHEIPNHKILMDTMNEVGFLFLDEHSNKDKIIQRYMSKQRNKTADYMDYEYILVFKKIKNI